MGASLRRVSPLDVSSAQRPPGQVARWCGRLKAALLVTPLGLAWHQPQLGASVEAEAAVLKTLADLASRDAWAVRVFFWNCCIALAASVLLRAPQHALPYSVLGFTGSLLVSDTRTWGACAWFITAVGFAYGVGWVVVVTTGLCGDQPGAARPELLQFDQRGFNLCAFKHAKIYPDWPLLIICASNFAVVILHRIGHRLHGWICHVQVALFATGGLSTAAGGMQRPVDVLLSLWVAFFIIAAVVWLVEREKRYHFLESHSKLRQVQQEKMLAALLCHEIKTPLTTIAFFLDKLAEQGWVGTAAAAAATTVVVVADGEGEGEGGEGSGGAGAAGGGAAATTEKGTPVKGPPPPPTPPSLTTTKKPRSSPPPQLSPVAGRQLPSSAVAQRMEVSRRMLPDVVRSADILVDIVENCRHLAKIESGTFEQQRDVVNLGQLAESCLAIHGRAREAGLRLELQCADELAIVSDRRLWLHVLMNLVGNAVKFTMLEVDGAQQSPRPQHSRVTLRIQRAEAGRVSVEIEDTGPGIAKDQQAAIFGKFVQAGRGFRSQGLGSGLGLHLSAKIVQMLDGELDLTSPLRDGRGARFRFTVPCLLSTIPPAGASSSAMIYEA